MNLWSSFHFVSTEFTRIPLYTDVLVTMQALFGASDQVSRDEFRDFVRTSETTPWLPISGNSA
ncbi:hypothetical protein AWV79_34615 [Cupriavidus sp. UYMMa02A]|nr:hypothetical protein AWV79_34615 [Cupriavidus sp. UYMMa02A]